ncbi:MAG: YceI family protein [Desulfobacterales bacterium]
MKKLSGITALIFCVVLCVTGLSHAQAEEWKIDENHSSIYFDVDHTFVTVRGLFDDYSGNVVFDPEDEDASSIDFTVKVDSIDTNITKRDNHLRSDDFFAAGKYPEMSFSSKEIRHEGDDQYTVKGDLTIKSVTREVEVPFRFLGMKDNPMDDGQKVAGFEAEFTINRLDYNVGTGKFAEMGVVGEEVNILVALEIIKDL